jgi:hypothetical protein
LFATALVTSACGGGGGAGGSSLVGPAGGVTLLSTACSGLGSGGAASCRFLRVETQNNPGIDVELRILEAAPGTAFVGTVVVGSGGGGEQFYGDTSGGALLIAELRERGLRVIDRRWLGGWSSGGESIREMSARYAVLLRWIDTFVHDAGVLAAVGYSGGSNEIAYGLTSWGIDDVLDRVVLTSGPGFARLDYMCIEPLAPWSSQCPAIVPAGALTCSPIQCTLPAATVCTGRTEAELLADSVLHPLATTAFPTTPIDVLLGADDCSTSVPLGLVFAGAVSTPLTLAFVPEAPHELQQTVRGRRAIVRALLAGTAPAGPAKTHVGFSITVIEGDGATSRVEGRGVHSRGAN